MCEAPSTWRASTCAIDARSRSAAYIGLMAAPGTPNAWVMPSFSITRTAAMTAFMRAMRVSWSVLTGVDGRAGGGAWECLPGDKCYSGAEWVERALGRQPVGLGRRPTYFHLLAQMKVGKAKCLNASPSGSIAWLER